MTDSSFKPGDDVLTPGVRGTVIDVRATPGGQWVYGVESVTGAVSYYTSKALRHAKP